jgi:hypothetical protein
MRRHCSCLLNHPACHPAERQQDLYQQVEQQQQQLSAEVQHVVSVDEYVTKTTCSRHVTTPSG